MRALSASVVFLCACGSAAAPPPVEPAPAAPAPRALATLTATCGPAEDAPRGDPTSMRGVFGQEATVRIGVASVAAGEAPAVRVPVGDAEQICRVDYAPACVDAEPDGPVEVDASGEVELGFLRDDTGALRPIAWYRTVVHGMGPPVESEGSTTQSARCRETVEWVWLATDDGAALVATPQVGVASDACFGELTARVDGGLYCLERSGDACPELAAPACYRLEGGRLVETDAAPVPLAETPAHPWIDPDALPFPSRRVAEAAIATVRDPVLACLPAGDSVGFRLHFDGSGQVTVRQIAHDPPLDEAAERCVRDALETMRHPPFQGTLLITGHLP